MTRRYATAIRLLTVLTDAAVAILAFYAAYTMRSVVPLPTRLRLGPFRNYVGQLFIQVGSLLVTLFFFRLYHPQRHRSRIDLLYGILSATSIASLVATALSFLTFRADQGITRGLVIYNWGFTIVLLTAGRACVGWLERVLRRRHPERLLVLGTGETARMILQKTQKRDLGYRVVGFVDHNGATGEIAGVPILGTVQDLERLVREYQIQEVIIALPEASHDELLDLISICERGHATVRIFPDLFQIVASELQISDLDGLPLLSVRDVALRGWKLTLKRGMDLIVSATGLIFLSPLMMLIALLIKLESKGPVFYTQTRVGLDGKPFPMLKFRSMRVDAEKDTGPVWATPDDPRRTKIGAILRRTSLDELPQLINVLLGQMSLVGPRPERPVFVEQFKQVLPRYMERHAEKAGLTGWAQVNGLRGETSIVERTKYDLYYVENWSLFFDLKILVRTVLNFIRGDRNAY